MKRKYLTRRSEIKNDVITQSILANGIVPEYWSQSNYMYRNLDESITSKIALNTTNQKTNDDSEHVFVKVISICMIWSIWIKAVLFGSDSNSFDSSVGYHVGFSAKGRGFDPCWWHLFNFQESAAARGVCLHQPMRLV